MLEKSLDEGDKYSTINAIKNELDAIYDYITDGIKIRSKCDCYEHNEKSAKFFLNLDKHRGEQNTILVRKENTDQKILRIWTLFT